MILTKPWQLDEAQTVLGLCRQFHCLPGQLEKEGPELIRLLRIEQLGTPERRPEEGGEQWPTS